LAFVTPSIGGLDEHQRREHDVSKRIAPFGGIRDHRQPFTGSGLEVDRELVEETLHPQQRRDVGLIIDAACHIQELMETAADKLVGAETRPDDEGGVDFRDAPVGPDGEVTAGSVFEQVFVFVDGTELRHMPE
jgi:hypothetical protein